MGDMQVVIISEHTDFANELAEHVRKQLGVVCRTASSAELVDDNDMAVRVTTSSLPAQRWPVLQLGDPPYRLVTILSDLDSLLRAEPPTLALSGGLSLHLREGELCFGASCQALTDKEVSILQCLVGAGGEPVSKEELLRTVWGYQSSLDTHTLETHIYRLRNKIRDLCANEQVIAAVGGGYAIVHEQNE